MIIGGDLLGTTTSSVSGDYMAQEIGVCGFLIIRGLHYVVLIWCSLEADLALSRIFHHVKILQA